MLIKNGSLVIRWCYSSSQERLFNSSDFFCLGCKVTEDFSNVIQIGISHISLQSKCDITVTVIITIVSFKHTHPHQHWQSFYFIYTHKLVPVVPKMLPLQCRYLRVFVVTNYSGFRSILYDRRGNVLYSGVSQQDHSGPIVLQSWINWLFQFTSMVSLSIEHTYATWVTDLGQIHMLAMTKFLEQRQCFNTTSCSCNWLNLPSSFPSVNFLSEFLHSFIRFGLSGASHPSARHVWV